MTLFVAPADVFRLTPDAHCSVDVTTAVLQHANGAVGFERGEGKQLLESVVAGSVACELSNTPDWSDGSGGTIVSFVLRASLSTGAMTIHGASAPVLDELREVKNNLVHAKQNQVRVRHGKPPFTLASTRFDDWVTNEKQVRGESLAWLCQEAKYVLLWRRSEWGLYFRAATVDRSLVLRELIEKLGQSEADVKQLGEERDLPVW